ncbi:MAG: ABC transporter ATP-binding protein [Actinomycetota bacterium]
MDDLSFDLRRGEALAVLGHNGAGKSTLLKLLCGLLKPDRGEIRLGGRPEALLELGTGFNPLLTGRENIQVGAARHGFSGERTRRLIDEVVDFAELKASIDAPFQSYSTGMKSRLAYALSSRLKPDIFLVDEVLAVGDHVFQRKCIGHMRSYLEAGGALVLISHNSHQVQAVCHRGILLHQGRSVFEGTAVEAVSRQLEMEFGTVQADASTAPDPGAVAIEELRAEGLSGGDIRTGDAARVTIRYRAAVAVEGAWGFGIWTADEMVCVTGAYGEECRTLAPGTGELSCVVKKLPLLPGRYSMRAVILQPAVLDPLASYGWNGRGAPLVVKAPMDALTNELVKLGQLVRADVDWQ